jgi:hypothetical protein
MRANWLADEIRAMGAPVTEDSGWQSRGYELTAIQGIIFHHTASNPGSDPAGDINYIWHSSGNSLVPEYNVYISRSGMVYVGCSGKTNNAGEGGNNGNNSTCSRFPINWAPANGANGYGISIVMANNGVGEQYPTAQQDSAVKACAAVVRKAGFPVGNLNSHFEWTKRKIDPAGNSRYATGSNMWDMNKFRSDVQAAISGGPPQPSPEDDVPQLKKLCQIKGDNAIWLVLDNTRRWCPDSQTVNVQKSVYGIAAIDMLDPPTDLKVWGAPIGPMPTDKPRDEWGIPT